MAAETVTSAHTIIISVGIKRFKTCKFIHILGKQNTAFFLNEVWVPSCYPISSALLISQKENTNVCTLKKGSHKQVLDHFSLIFFKKTFHFSNACFAEQWTKRIKIQIKPNEKN